MDEDIKNDIEIIYGKVDEMQAMMDDWNATIRSPYAVVVDLIKQGAYDVAKQYIDFVAKNRRIKNEPERP